MKKTKFLSLIALSLILSGVGGCNFSSSSNSQHSSVSSKESSSESLKSSETLPESSSTSESQSESISSSEQSSSSKIFSSFNVSEERIWLERYEELEIVLTSGNLDDLTITSGDSEIVTVEDGKYIAQGEGKTTVAFSNGEQTQVVNVTVIDSGFVPAFKVKSFECYKDISIELPIKISYNGAEYNVKEYNATIVDETVAKIEGHSITGLKVGESTKVNVDFNYKGLDFEKSLTVTVREGKFIEFDVDKIKVYACENNKKLGRYTLNPKVVYMGQPYTEASIVYTITQGKGNVKITDGVLYGLKEGTARIKAMTVINQEIISQEIDVEILPNYVNTSFVSASSYDLTYEPYTCPEESPIGGRSGDMNKYQINDALKVFDTESNKWKTNPDLNDGRNYFDYRLLSSDASLKYTDLYKRGYRYFAYDLYYNSGENFYMGLEHMSPMSMKVGEYFRHDGITICSNGVQTNRIESRKWITVCFDLYFFAYNYPTYNVGFFFCIEDWREPSYLMNIRYYLDNSFMPSDGITYEQQDGYVDASEQEFGIMIPTSTGESDFYSRGETVNPENVPTYEASDSIIKGHNTTFKYQTKITSSWKNSLVVASSMGKTYDPAFANLVSRGDYFTFDFYVDGDSADKMEDLKFSMNHTKLNAVIKIGVNNKMTLYSSWLAILDENGDSQTLINYNTWYKAVFKIRENYDTNPIKNCGASVIFSTNYKGTAYIDNVRFYKTNSFIKSEIESANLPKEVACVNDNMEVTFAEEAGFEGCYKYSNWAKNNAWDGLWFSKSVLPPNSPVSSYSSKYIRFDVYVETDNIAGLRGKNYYKTDHNYHIYRDGSKDTLTTMMFDPQTNELVDRFVSKKWYTYFLPTENNNPNWAMVYFQTLCGSTPFSAEEPGICYVRNISFCSDLEEYQEVIDTLNYGKYALNGTVSSENDQVKVFDGEGEFTNSAKVVFECNSSSWTGAYFENVCTRERKPSPNHKKPYVQFEVYIESTSIDMLRVVSYYSTDRKATFSTTDEPNLISLDGYTVSLKNQSGNEISNIVTGQWLTIKMPTTYGENANWGMFYVQGYSSTNALSAENPGVIYIRNIQSVTN